MSSPISRLCHATYGQLAPGTWRCPARCRLLIPKVLPVVTAGDSKTQRLLDKIAEARAKGDDSVLAKMCVDSGLHHAPYSIFDFRVSRHRDGPDEF